MRVEKYRYRTVRGNKHNNRYGVEWSGSGGVSSQESTVTVDLRTNSDEALIPRVWNKTFFEISEADRGSGEEAEGQKRSFRWKELNKSVSRGPLATSLFGSWPSQDGGIPGWTPSSFTIVKSALYSVET
jgi:hypothetical protein